MDTVATGRWSDTAYNRSPSIPLGRLGRGQSESLSDKRLFLGRDGRISVRREGVSFGCGGGDDGGWVLNGCQRCKITGKQEANLLRFDEGGSDESDDARFGDLLKSLSSGEVGYDSSSSSGLEENVSDGVGEMLRVLFGEGRQTTDSLPYTSSA